MIWLNSDMSYRLRHWRRAERGGRGVLEEGWSNSLPLISGSSKDNKSSASKWSVWCYQAHDSAAQVSKAQRAPWFSCPPAPWTKVFLPQLGCWGWSRKGDWRSGQRCADETAGLLLVLVNVVACEKPNTLDMKGKMVQVPTGARNLKMLFLIQVSDSVSVETS